METTQSGNVIKGILIGLFASGSLMFITKLVVFVIGHWANSI